MCNVMGRNKMAAEGKDNAILHLVKEAREALVFQLFYIVEFNMWRAGTENREREQKIKV